jgi:hypothetical protein
MFFNEEIHSGRPHFHAGYGGVWAVFDAANQDRLAGRLPRRLERLVRKWARIHQAELLENWERARARLPLARIEPLK